MLFLAIYFVELIKYYSKYDFRSDKVDIDDLQGIATMKYLNSKMDD